MSERRGGRTGDADGQPPLMLAEIREQPAVLAAVSERVEERLRSSGAERGDGRIHCVGCGDMAFAAEATRAMAGSVRAWRSMEARWWEVRGDVAAGDVVICASVSGRTPRTIEAARVAQRLGARVIAVTDAPGSAITQEVEDVLILGTAPSEDLERHEYAGYQNALAQTKTFTAALFAELLLVRGLGVGDLGDLDGIPNRLAPRLHALEGRAREIVEPTFRGAGHVVVLGSGPDAPVARYGAAKFLEFAVPSHAQCIEEYNHLELFLADGETVVVGLAADLTARSRFDELASSWRELGARVLGIFAEVGGLGGAELLLDVDNCTWELRVERLFAQVMALQLTALFGAAAIGRDVDRWLGGERTELLQRLSQKTIRGSRVDDGGS